MSLAVKPSDWVALALAPPTGGSEKYARTAVSAAQSIVAVELVPQSGKNAGGGDKKLGLDATGKLGSPFPVEMVSVTPLKI
jgi:hypothetical protein